VIQVEQRAQIIFANLICGGPGFHGLDQAVVDTVNDCSAVGVVKRHIALHRGVKGMAFTDFKVLPADELGAQTAIPAAPVGGGDQHEIARQTGQAEYKGIAGTASCQRDGIVAVSWNPTAMRSGKGCFYHAHLAC
jgi:hypothetical protein